MDPPYLAALKGEYGITRMGWFKTYQEKFINTSRFRPCMHVMGLVLCVGYLLEYPHLKRARPHPEPHACRPRRRKLACYSFDLRPTAEVSPFVVAYMCVQMSSMRARRRRPCLATTDWYAQPRSSMRPRVTEYVRNGVGYRWPGQRRMRRHATSGARAPCAKSDTARSFVAIRT